MKRLLPSLVLFCSATAAAQTRVRPMGEFRVESKGVSIVAVFEARSIREFVLDANERIDEASFFSSVRCTVGADAAARWADSTTILINLQVARPRAPDKMKYEGPNLPSDDCVIRVNRTVDAAGSTFGLTVLSRELMHHASAVAPVTQAQALAFIGKVRGTAAVTLAMSNITPGSPTNPLVVDDASPTPPRSDPAYFEFQVEKQYGT